MVQVFLTEEQARAVSQLGEAVHLCDPDGKVLRIIPPELTSEEIAELKRRAAAPGPRYTSAQVEARLKALQEEWDRMGSFDKAYMREFLRRLNEADPGHMRPKERAE